MYVIFNKHLHITIALYNLKLNLFYHRTMKHSNQIFLAKFFFNVKAVSFYDDKIASLLT